MNSKYFGGGMKIAPNARRDSEYLEVVIIKKLPKRLLFIIFPTIYFGMHTIFKNYVKVYSVKSVEVNVEVDIFMQVDGEDYFGVKNIKIKK